MERQTWRKHTERGAERVQDIKQAEEKTGSKDRPAKSEKASAQCRWQGQATAALAKLPRGS